MSDIVERLNGIWANDDHERGCQGREYSCSCGFDNRTAKTAEDAATEITRLRQLLSEAEKREREARVKALEEAALWHDARVLEYSEQIAVNDAYLARSSRPSSESRANEYCDDMRSCHRRAAAAIRALQSEER